MNGGTEWLVDASGCHAAALRNPETMRRLCQQIIDELDLHVVGQGLWRSFAGPGGMTGLFLLTESHLSCHTYPESGLATFNLYCCRPRPPWPWEERLRRELGATHVHIRRLSRGQHEEGGSS